MNSRSSAFGVALGCGVLLLIAIIAVPALFYFSVLPSRTGNRGNGSTSALSSPVAALPVALTEQAVPTLTALPSTAVPANGPLNQSTPELSALYDQSSPGVVNIRVFVSQQGQSGVAAGSGFILDTDGHIVTNNHVVAGAQTVFITFHDGTEAEAKIVGTDPDSDLAVVQVQSLPQGAHPLSLADSDKVKTGEWVAAIGNPFGLGTSMSVGIVSATGRTIESGATPFSIPEAIQTDAAINPGNSGGPLLNLQGEVIGVNAQIATGGLTQANSGVGFAIPANVVRRVAPVLIKTGSYQWPWLGIQGDSVNLLIAKANQLSTQKGAYIHAVEPGGPSDKAGLHGSRGTSTVSGADVPTGGDIVVQADGQPVNSFSDLLAAVDRHVPGDEMTLTIVRGGQQQQIKVKLEPRPAGTPTATP